MTKDEWDKISKEYSKDVVKFFEDSLTDPEGPEGEWTTEPDDFYFDYKGYSCAGNRNQMKVWCGYVFLPARHKILRDRYMEIPLEVHGGLTFMTKGKQEGTRKVIYVIGFDCGHLGDYIPGMRELYINKNSTYRNMAFVRAELEQLVDQIVAFDEENK